MRTGLLGRKLAHSLSPLIHGYLAPYRYELFEREEAELPAFFADESIRAFNVTIPYKVHAFHACDELSDTAKAIGSVNTVVRRADGTLFGDNTDAFGFSYMAKQAGAEFKNKKVLILGSGGASRTVQVVTKAAGACEVIVVSRSGNVNYNNVFDHADAQILVNTTPVGMYPKCGVSPLDLTPFRSLECVLDLIYNPLKTALLLQAEALGIPYANGLSMLAAQALRSAERFLDTIIDETKIGEIERAVTMGRRNIVLIGMPGCGKSTVAAALAKRLDRPAVDTDVLVEATDGRSIPAIFAEDGEAAFRNKETAAARQLGAELGQVIATGGGCMMRAENRDALRQNGFVVWLRRPLEQLARNGRPLSVDAAALKAMYSQRKGVYEAASDVIVDVDDSIETTVERVISCVC
ncbi:MAG: AAA family ATPase [Clostridia bacterium]|nr:AAA family ATPase [Clostridia bacterium]